MAVRVSLDSGATRRVPLQLVTPLVRKVGSAVERRARTQVRVKTGAVRASIKSELRVTSTRVTMTVRATHRRAMLEHQGAKPHAIASKPGGPLLHFYWQRIGGYVTVHSVNHPGTDGSKFLTSPLILHGVRNGFRVKLDVGGLSGTIL